MNAKHTIIVGLLLLAGCRNPGLPPEAPEQDATNPEVLSADVGAPADPFTRSAFEGVELGGGGHHGHHGHGKAKPETKAEPATAEPATEGQPSQPADHSGHDHGGRS